VREKSTKKCISFLNELEQMLIGPFSNDLNFIFHKDTFKIFFVDRMQQNAKICYLDLFISNNEFMRGFHDASILTSLPSTSNILFFEIDVFFL